MNIEVFWTALTTEAERIGLVLAREREDSALDALHLHAGHNQKAEDAVREGTPEMARRLTESIVKRAGARAARFAARELVKAIKR